MSSDGGSDVRGIRQGAQEATVAGGDWVAAVCGNDELTVSIDEWLADNRSARYRMTVAEELGHILLRNGLCEYSTASNRRCEISLIFWNEPHPARCSSPEAPTGTVRLGDLGVR